jgi:HSP20 family protein
MTLTTYSQVDEQMDRLLNEVIGTLSGRALAWAPACNTYEDEQGFWVEAAVPGFDQKDIEIAIEDGVLTVKSELKNDTPEPNRNYFVREIGRGAFSRSFRLPSSADPNKVSATYKQGVLTIALAKREEAKPHRITIETQ